MNTTLWVAQSLLAFGFHVLRAEYGALGANILLGSLAVFVAGGRKNKAPILSREG